MSRGLREAKRTWKSHKFFQKVSGREIDVGSMEEASSTEESVRSEIEAVEEAAEFVEYCSTILDSMEFARWGKWWQLSSITSIRSPQTLFCR